MKCLRKLGTIVALFAALMGLQEANATSLTGTIKYPDGTGVTGRLLLHLPQSASQTTNGSCSGPALLVPTTDISITITNGSLVSPPTIVGIDCLLPAQMFYVATIKDPQGNNLTVDQWSISGTTFDVGTVVPTTINVAFSGALLLTPPSSADQAIAGNILANGSRNIGNSTTGRWNTIFGTVGNFSSSLNVGGTLTQIGDATFSGNIIGPGGTKTLTGWSFVSYNANAAATGLIRMAPGDQQCWESNSLSATACLLLDSSNILATSNGGFQLGASGANGIAATQLGMNTNSKAATITFTDGTGNLSFNGFTSATLPPFTRFNGAGGVAVVAGNFVPSAGFGTTATVSAPAAGSNEVRGAITVTASGTGQAANPAIVFTFPGGAYSSAPFCFPIKQDASTPTTAYWESNSSTTTTCTFTFIGTPAVNGIYLVEYLVVQ